MLKVFVRRKDRPLSFSHIRYGIFRSIELDKTNDGGAVVAIYRRLGRSCMEIY
jgi:hypothetical protein